MDPSATSRALEREALPVRPDRIQRIPADEAVAARAAQPRHAQIGHDIVGIDNWQRVTFPAPQPPLLVVVVDTEAEFDWRKTPRRATGVRSERSQVKAQRIFDRFGVRPCYALDYPVGSTPEGYEPIREILKDGRCVIGTHLQPWDTPPFTEFITDRNSFPGWLSADLEREKLDCLTRTIAENLGVRPRIYKAGRYGIGKYTSETLLALGYEVDVSVLPYTDLSHNFGPDFSGCDAHPHWIDADRRLLEIPLSIGFTGFLARHGRAIHRRLGRPRTEAWHAPGVFARLKLLERITLTPEGVTFEEQRRLTRAMLRQGHRVFHFTYHSPSLLPGNTPYVSNDAELVNFLDRIERYMEFFLGELGGRPATPFEVRQAALGLSAAGAPRPASP